MSVCNKTKCFLYKASGAPSERLNVNWYSKCLLLKVYFRGIFSSRLVCLVVNYNSILCHPKISLVKNYIHFTFTQHFLCNHGS